MSSGLVADLCCPFFKTVSLSVLTFLLLRSADSRYSVFTVKKVEWASDPDESHLVVLQAAIDNLREPDDLPLCPWY